MGNKKIKNEERTCVYSFADVFPAGNKKYLPIFAAFSNTKNAICKCFPFFCGLRKHRN